MLTNFIWNVYISINALYQQKQRVGNLSDLPDLVELLIVNISLIRRISRSSTFLPSANEVAERKCFHKSVSRILSTVGVSASVHAGIDTPLGRHPPADTPHPWADTPLWADTPQADNTSPQQMATAADGTHPTGNAFLCQT